jgi:hypothetical protein
MHCQESLNNNPCMSASPFCSFFESSSSVALDTHSSLALHTVVPTSLNNVSSPSCTLIFPLTEREGLALPLEGRVIICGSFSSRVCLFVNHGVASNSFPYGWLRHIGPLQAIVCFVANPQLGYVIYHFAGRTSYH